MKYRIPLLLNIILFLNSLLTYANIPLGDEYYEKGMKDFEEKKFKEAILDFTSYIKIFPDRPEAYNCRAMARIEANELAKAWKDVNHVLHLSPNNHEAIYLKGLIYEKRGEYEKAYNCYTKAITLFPDFAIAHSRRDEMVFKLGYRTRTL